MRGNAYRRDVKDGGVGILGVVGVGLDMWIPMWIVKGWGIYKYIYNYSYIYI